MLQKSSLRVYKAIVILFLQLCFLSSFSFAANSALLIEPRDGRQPILEAIHHAKSSIDLAIYSFTDPALMQALIQAKQEGKKVRVLLQRFPYKAIRENIPAIEYFSKNHLNYAFAPRTFFLLHQKTLIIDHYLAVVMTFNFTRSTFKSQRNFGLMTTDPQLVKEIQQVFDADWRGQKPHFKHPKLVWSPDNSRAKILNLIRSAKVNIKIYAQGLSDYQVLDALRNAARQGIVVQIVTSTPLPQKKQKGLKRAGVQFHINRRLMIHAKMIMVDQQKAMLGSINFTRTSIDRNRELAVLIANPVLLKQLLQVFQKDWND